MNYLTVFDSIIIFLATLFFDLIALLGEVTLDSSAARCLLFLVCFCYLSGDLVSLIYYLIFRFRSPHHCFQRHIHSLLVLISLNSIYFALGLFLIVLFAILDFLDFYGIGKTRSAIMYSVFFSFRS